MDSICTNIKNAIEYRNDISDGAGLLVRKNSPFKNIPVWDGYCNYLEEMYIIIEYSIFLLTVCHL